MPDSDRVSIDNLTLAPDLSSNDVAPVVHTVNGVKSTYKATMTLLGTFLNKILQYSADLTTTDKTIIGAINEINAGGGGGGAVILYGTTAPASALGSDGNLYVQYTAGTGGASDVVDALYAKLDGEWCEITTKQVQSDWSQADNTKVDYIKNKPSLATVATSGSYNDLLDKPTIQVFSRNDVLLNSIGGTVRGFGTAMITMQNGIARIDFNLKITVAETVQNIFTWGINRDYFTALTGKQISPQAGGSCVYYDSNNVVYDGRTELGGLFLVAGQFWQPARVYDDNGTCKVGGWASSAYQQNSRIVGTCYGTYT